MDKADLVIKSNAVFTGDGLAPFKGGVAVAGDRIVACGEDKYLDAFIGPDTEVRDYGDKLVMPGIIDSHTHYAQGSFVSDPDFAVNLIDCTSFEQCMERVQAFAEDHPNNEWIVGYQVIQFQWDVPEMPTAAMIDEYISDRPVFLQQVDVHTFSANTCAIEKIGITAETPDPSGGKILRDEAGNPTGVFSNNAGSLFLDEVYNPAPEVASASFAKTAHRANALGITTVGMVNPTFVSMDNPYKFLAELNRKGELPLRVFMYTDLFEDEAMTLEEIRAKYDFPGTQVEWHGFKQFIDGVCSDHTAWMLEPYANAPETCGEPAEEPERVRKAILKALEWGVDTRIHAIGDRSVRFILDCFEEGEKRYGLMGCRHSMEHNETVQPEDLPRYAELGVCPAMQPWHMLLDMADLQRTTPLVPSARRSRGQFIACSRAVPACIWAPTSRSWGLSLWRKSMERSTACSRMDLILRVGSPRSESLWPRPCAHTPTAAPTLCMLRTASAHSPAASKPTFAYSTAISLPASRQRCSRLPRPLR